MKKKLLLLLSIVVMLSGIAFLSVKAFETHSVTYNMNGGFQLPSATITETRWIDDIQLLNPFKQHYTFNGWTDESGEEVTSIKHASTDVVLTAHWIPRTYKINFKDNDKVISKSMYAYGSNPQLTEVYAKSVLDDHPYENFAGWKNSNGDVITEIDSKCFGNLVLTVAWTGKKYNITYQLGGGSLSSDTLTYRYGEGLSELPTPVKDGYTFNGWYSDSDLTQKITSIDKDSHEDVTLYAKYTEISWGTSNQVSTSRTRYNNIASNSGGVSTGYSGATDTLEIPAINFKKHVIWDASQAEVDAGNAFYESYTFWGYVGNNNGEPCAENQIGCISEEVKTTLIWAGSHASGGLSRLPYRISAGADVYIAGKHYTYSGVWYEFENSTNLDYDKVLGYSAFIQTCNPSNSGNFYLMLY